MPVDLVLVEGYKREAHPKIEAHRRAAGQPLIAPGDDSIRAVASDSMHEMQAELDQVVLISTTLARLLIYCRRPVAVIAWASSARR